MLGAGDKVPLFQGIVLKVVKLVAAVLRLHVLPAFLDPHAQRVQGVRPVHGVKLAGNTLVDWLVAAQSQLANVGALQSISQLAVAQGHDRGYQVHQRTTRAQQCGEPIPLGGRINSGNRTKFSYITAP